MCMHPAAKVWPILLLVCLSKDPGAYPQPVGYPFPPARFACPTTRDQIRALTTRQNDSSHDLTIPNSPIFSLTVMLKLATPPPTSQLTPLRRYPWDAHAESTESLESPVTLTPPASAQRYRVISTIPTFCLDICPSQKIGVFKVYPPPTADTNLGSVATLIYLTAQLNEFPLSETTFVSLSSSNSSTFITCHQLLSLTRVTQTHELLTHTNQRSLHRRLLICFISVGQPRN
ncbi:hypothetical protein B0T17DRAFT_397809 [Bombardia bombarda]|uniref:Uncharacterized protein n=1 Tax=Bombardia bombarda TaxID=252184 RepID=A0AA39WBT7_9PEZI|nr:hypothetical protein B0T17DRAFT_397809 [Bombardia bombarda]